MIYFMGYGYIQLNIIYVWKLCGTFLLISFRWALRPLASSLSENGVLHSIDLIKYYIWVKTVCY